MLCFILIFILCMYFPLDWEYILPMLILGAGLSQYGVSLWTGYAPKTPGTILSCTL